MTNTLDFDHYQHLANQTALYPGRGAETIAPYPALGLAGEAGEVCEEIKKAIRDDGGVVTPERRERIQKELGDILWYVAALCSDLDLKMSEVARANIEKLADRKARGVIQGEGSQR